MSNQRKKFKTNRQRVTPVAAYPIKGMHCRACQLLIEEKLNQIPGVEKAVVNYKEKIARVYSNDPIAAEIVNQAVKEAGYEVGDDIPKEWFSKDSRRWKEAFITLFFLVLLYFVAKGLGLFNLKVGNGSNPSSLLVVLVVGLTAGFSTCMALVGGLILGIFARFSEKHPQSAPIQKFRPHLFFQIGRIASYFFLGGVIGLLGKAFQFSGGVLGALLILAGIVMLVLGAQLTELFPKLAGISFSLPSSVGKFLGIKKHHDKEYSHMNAMISGALTFFLPCGFTQSMQLFAMSTGNFWSGALIMATFALGTAPGLLGIGGLTSVVKGAFAKCFFQAAGILVIALAVFNINNGLNLSGLKARLATPKRIKTATEVPAADPNVRLVDGVQVVTMEQNTYGYSPNKFTIKKGIPVKWIVNSTDSNTCAASIYASQIGVQKILSPGQNIIQFTPGKTGKISFSCSMGMYRGIFNVV